MLAYYSTRFRACQAFFEKIFDYFDLAGLNLSFSLVFAPFCSCFKDFKSLFSMISGK
jgi:hypothetical protein